MNSFEITICVCLAINLIVILMYNYKFSRMIALLKIIEDTKDSKYTILENVMINKHKELEEAIDLLKSATLESYGVIISVSNKQADHIDELAYRMKLLEKFGDSDDLDVIFESDFNPKKPNGNGQSN